MGDAEQDPTTFNFLGGNRCTLLSINMPNGMFMRQNILVYTQWTKNCHPHYKMQ